MGGRKELSPQTGAARQGRNWFLALGDREGYRNIRAS